MKTEDQTDQVTSLDFDKEFSHYFPNPGYIHPGKAALCGARKITTDQTGTQPQCPICMAMLDARKK